MGQNCLIITAYIDAIHHLHIDFDAYDYIICADGGLTNARTLGLHPKLLIGDFDSEHKSLEDPISRTCEIIRLPAEKNMTDTEAAVDLAVSRGYTRITCLGGLGGRFDHTMGNIGMLSKYCGTGVELDFVDGINRVTMLSPGGYKVHPDGFYYLGFFAWGGPVNGLTLEGTKYPLTDFLLSDDTSRCVSNEILAEEAVVSFQTGRLLMIQSSDVN